MAETKSNHHRQLDIIGYSMIALMLLDGSFTRELS